MHLKFANLIPGNNLEEYEIHVLQKIVLQKIKIGENT